MTKSEFMVNNKEEIKMANYSINPNLTLTDDDILDVISSAIYDIGYWACIDNNTDSWRKVREALPKEDRVFDEIFFKVLKNGDTIHLLDVEDEEEIYILTLDKLINGIKLAIEHKYWDGDMDVIDGEIGDIIFQYALFDEIVFG
jgi:hypothetical protein